MQCVMSYVSTFLPQTRLTRMNVPFSVKQVTSRCHMPARLYKYVELYYVPNALYV